MLRYILRGGLVGGLEDAGGVASSVRESMSPSVPVGDERGKGEESFPLTA